MANLNIKLVKSLNGRIAKHKATPRPWAFTRSATPPCSPTTRLPGARSPTSATCFRSPRKTDEGGAREMNLHELSRSPPPPAPVPATKTGVSWDTRAEGPFRRRRPRRVRGRPDASGPPPAQARFPQHFCQAPGVHQRLRSGEVRGRGCGQRPGSAGEGYPLQVPVRLKILGNGT